MNSNYYKNNSVGADQARHRPTIAKLHYILLWNRQHTHSTRSQCWRSLRAARSPSPSLARYAIGLLIQSI
ncbi:MAG: hypothetical protein KME52_10665 [Desmonostoc geniculatum HA4340-LM1]|nr:hypothetical protein [Desmonostoc geniculatum HA4340-LM1]